MKRLAFCILITISFGTVFCVRDFINCYNCIGDSCGANVTDLQLVTCPQYCCYAATTRDASSITNIRRCVDKGLDCNKFCVGLRLNSTLAGKETLHCKSCSDSLCNDDELIKTIKCYQCSDCNVVTSTTKLVNCVATDGCYMDVGEPILRGCVGVCKTHSCRACNTEKCNSEEYINKTNRVNGSVYKSKHDIDKNIEIQSSSIKCFECRHCNKVSGNTTWVNCKSVECCYQAIVKDYKNQDFFTVRGCVEGNCDNTCNQFQSNHLKQHVDGMIDSCTPCTDDGDLCNKHDYKLPEATTVNPIQCYNCTSCDNVTSVTELVNCAPACCYAGVSEDSIVRGCYNLEDEQICENTCEYLAKRNIVACLSCMELHVDRCNSKAYPREIQRDPNDIPIMCYNCENCNVVQENTSRVTCPKANCCYSAIIDGYTERHCYIPKFGETCEDTCKQSKVNFCMSCEKDGTNNCNNIEFHREISGMNCYNCTNCNFVTSNTSVIKCPFATCCYTTIVKKDDIIYANRGCSFSKNCKEACKSITKSDKSIQFCFTCNEDDSGLCNRNNYHPAKPAKLDVLCYNCKNCSKITETTPVVNCIGAGCCYIAALKDHKNDSYYTDRGCFDNNNSCYKTCDYVKRKHLVKFPEGKLHMCLTCSIEKDKCNRNDYHAPKWVEIKPVDCYHCRNCNVVTKMTPVNKCPRAECCYKAVVRNEPDEVNYVIRGCADVHKCYETCDSIKTSHMSKYPRGELGVCVTCNEYASDRCNENDYHPSIYGDNRDYYSLTIGKILCYDCSNCDVVNASTTTKRCMPGCCYNSVVRDMQGEITYAIRGCANLKSYETCADACKAAEREYSLKYSHGIMYLCMSCEETESDGCNSIDYHHNDHEYAAKDARRPFVFCYVCRNCSEVTDDIPLIKCFGLCYNGVIKDDTYIRGCTSLGTCKDAESDHMYKHPKESFKSCILCMDDRCNQKNPNFQQQPQIEYLKQSSSVGESVTCYKCRDCNKITNTTEKVSCPSVKCCYKAGVKNRQNDLVFIKRDCIFSELNAGESCDDTCNVLKRIHLLAHRCGSIEYCMSCNNDEGDYCNSNQYHPLEPDNPRAVKCYDCDNCNYVSSETSVVTCQQSSCCYHAVLNRRADEVFYSVRGCYEPDPTENCLDTCMYLKHINDFAYPNGTFNFCMTCGQYDITRCNRNDYHPIDSPVKKLERVPLMVSCYSCRHCSNVTVDTPTVYCSFRDCCYKAIVKDHAGDSFLAVRGCYDTEDHEACTHTCKRMARKHMESHTDGEFYYCDTCKDEVDGCNSNDYSRTKQSFLTPTVCYSCINCDKITKDTPVTLCPIKTCCYMAVRRDYEDSISYSIRGCAELEKGEICADACSHMKRNHLEHYPEGGSVSFCMTCDEDDSDRCNKNDYDDMYEGGYMAGIKCYECRRCSNVGSTTPTVLCRTAECCYSASVNEVKNQPPFIVRGCVLLEPGEFCHEACSYVRRAHLIQHVSGAVFDCVTCARGDTSGCNSKDTTEIPVPGTSILCYQCRNCNIVTVLTPTVWCSRPTCCYNAIIREEVKGTHYTIRGCQLLRYGESCGDTCSLVEAEQLELHPNGKLDYCLACNVYDTHKCNRNDFNIAKMWPRKPSFITCYECRHCNTVHNNNIPKHNKVVCSEPQCCYKAVVTEKPEDKPFAIRGCASIKPGESCRNACAYVKRDHLKRYVHGSFEFCITCNEYSGNDCNQNDIHEGDFLEPIKCYDCRDCESVSHINTTVTCASRCCYSAVLQGKKRFHSERKCVPGKVDMTFHTCGRYCAKFKEEHVSLYPTGLVKDCEVCSTSNCNLRVIHLKPRIPLPEPTESDWPVDTGSVMCYVCDKCYTPPDESHLQICPSKCCYTLIFTEGNKNTKAQRDCLPTDDTYKCKNYCLDRKMSVENGQKNIVHECNSCSTSKCNKEVYTKPSKQRREIRSAGTNMSCYSCRDCENVDQKTITIPCPSSCCYSTMLQLDSGEYITERRCARTTTAQLCHKFACRTARILHHMEYPKGKLFDCVMCSTHLCNSRNMITPNATALIGGPINCYVCVGCYSIRNDTIKKLCSTQCCFTVLWTEFSGTNIARLCATEECTRHPCKSFEEDIRNDSRSIIHYCESCRSNECNSIALKKPIIPKVRCYHCKDCTEVTADTHIVYCPRECCYTALYQIGDELVTKRSCAKALESELKCIDYCTKSKEKENKYKGIFLDCEMCSSNRCNYRRLFAAKTTLAPRNDFRCYQCIGCYMNITVTEIRTCPTGVKCCIAKVQTDTVGTNSIRSCAEFTSDEQTCDKYCTQVQSRTQVQSSTPRPYTYNFCKTCNVSGCNAWRMYRAIRCYECENCVDVDANTTKVKCSSNCCFSVLLKDKDNHVSNTRECAKLGKDKQCRDFCQDFHSTKKTAKVEASDCEVCSRDKCNNRHMVIPPPPPKSKVIRCYQCVGCWTVDDGDVTVECPDKCCCETVWTEFGGTNSERKCVKLKQGKTCKDGCQEIVSPNTLVEDSQTIIEQFFCEKDLCNYRELHRKITHIHCHTCESNDNYNCLKINNGHTKLDDSCSSDCCYSTMIESTAGKRTSERKCAKDTYLGCHRYCLDYGKKLLKNTENGVVDPRYIVNCVVCSTDKCNNRTISENIPKPNFKPSQSEVRCYKCNDCYEFNEPQEEPEICQSQCCYAGKGVRKCVKNDNNEEIVCNDYLCENIPNCKICNTNKCNNQKMEKPDGRSISCYSCLNCYTTDKDADSLQCPDQCCAMYLFTEFAGINLVRKCVTLNGTLCENYCSDHVRNYLKTPDPQSILHECKVCSHEKCNDWKVAKPTDILPSPEDIMQCYNCVGCHTVLSDTKKEKCPTRCCHEARWKEFGAYNIVRQCITKLRGISCKQYCTYFEKQIKQLDPDAFSGNLCGVCNTDLCNNATFSDIEEPGTVAPVNTDKPPEGGIDCFHCLGCKNTTGYDTIFCPQYCCYTVLWTESGLTHIARRCASKEKGKTIKCTPETVCESLKEEMRLNDRNGILHKCTTCNQNRCNKEPLGIDSVTTPHCYKCHNCNQIKSDTPTTYCLSSCCYAYRWRAKDGRFSTKRDCARNVTQCGNYCKNLKNHPMQCRVCNTDKCNKEKFEPKEPDLSHNIKCYDCIGCYNVTSRAPSTRCSSNCCYSVLWSELDVTYAARRCATLYGENCDTVCESMQDMVESVDPSSMIHTCKSCSTQKCNSNKLPMPATGKKDKNDISIDCYECRDCDKITKSKIHLHCHSGCCYSLYLQYLDGRVGSKRKCAKVIPGQSCDTLCNYFREEYKKTAVVKTCDTCTTNKCNRRIVHRRQKRSSSVCYDCVGCDSIKPSTRTSESPDDCCYSVIWTEFSTKNSARYPAELFGTSCGNFCEIVRLKLKKSDPEGLIHYCNVCTGDRCNNEELEQSIEISCYNDEMESVGCPSKCCYTVLRRIQGEVVATRSCAKVTPGRPCQKHCDYARNNTGVFSCNVCSENNCNGLQTTLP